jgi:putative endonuclease
VRDPRPTIAGLKGEKLALKYLKKEGLKLKCKNYSCKLGEIDLIMQDGEVRVFVEVRLRAPTSYGAGYETVFYQKQKKIISTARYYQQKENYWGDIRFDVVSVEMDDSTGEKKIQHIPNAFEADC